MPYEYTPPKYAQVIAELQRRIESGEYPPGSLMPSEHQLSAEFGTARPTVVRALRVLRQEGWIETQQGKGSFVRGRPALAEVTVARRGQGELDRDEAREGGELVSVGLAVAPAADRCAAGLAEGPGTGVPQAARPPGRRNPPRWSPGGSRPSWPRAPTWPRADPLRGGIRAYLARRKGVRVDHVVEQVTARHPSAARGQAARHHQDGAGPGAVCGGAGCVRVAAVRAGCGRCRVTCMSWRTPTRSGRGTFPRLLIA